MDTGEFLLKHFWRQLIPPRPQRKSEQQKLMDGLPRRLKQAARAADDIAAFVEETNKACKSNPNGLPF